MLGVTGTGVLSSSAEVTCTFEKGVPATETAVTPLITFVTGTNENTAYNQ